MSSRQSVNIKCPECNHQFEFTTYRSIWGEYPENRELVMSDKINVASCPSCKVKIRVVDSLFYTNAKQFFALWWEPSYDVQIDESRVEYAKLLGEESYLATAPRVSNWEEFKDTIVKFETGELKTNIEASKKGMEDSLERLLKEREERENKDKK